MTTGGGWLGDRFGGAMAVAAEEARALEKMAWRLGIG
jgi:hypothetical protein